MNASRDCEALNLCVLVPCVLIRLEEVTKFMSRWHTHLIAKNNSQEEKETMKKKTKQGLATLVIVAVAIGVYLYSQTLISIWNKPTQAPIITYNVGNQIETTGYVFAGWETVGAGVNAQVYAHFTSATGKSDVLYNYASTGKTVILTNPYNVVSVSIAQNSITLQEIVAVPA